MTELLDPSVIEDTVRHLLAETGRLAVDPATLGPTADLYAAGLSSLSTVDLMLATEDHFGIEFTAAWLNRRTFATIAGLAHAVRALLEQGP